MTIRLTIDLDPTEEESLRRHLRRIQSASDSSPRITEEDVAVAGRILRELTASTAHDWSRPQAEPAWGELAVAKANPWPAALVAGVGAFVGVIAGILGLWAATGLV